MGHAVSFWDDARFAVIDTETTGLHDSARILSVAIYCLENESTAESWSTLINSGEYGATHIHNLDATKLARAKPFAHHADRIRNLLTLDGATQLNYSLLASDTTVGGGINDLVTGVTNLTLTGVLNVAGIGDWTAVAPGTSWRLFDYSGSLTGSSLTLGSMPTLTAGYSFVIDTSTTGQVNLSVVPEPAALATIGIGGLVAACGLARRRRSGR